ncbi:unnamed protein product [Bemisia tabaci]|uniref:Protein hook n=1 Tax=Bemisia tabaci TaxID=7038 RepID=A0A9P0AHG6_BEMTA|nr:unnamed protein product [Bemisia tabaci]
MESEKVEKELCSNLLKWLQTFQLSAPHSKLHEITDGVAIAQALHQIAPEWFDDAWLSKIKVDVGSNWRLKVSNLKKIVESIVDFYNDIFNQGLAECGKPDVMKIADQVDPLEIARLLQLVLGCAVNSERRQEYITKIMDLEESVQQVIMQSIQELETMVGSGPGPISFTVGLDQQVQQLMSELQVVTEARDQMAQRCLELDMQVSLLQEEKANALEEKRRIEERLQETAEDPKNSGLLRRQVESLKEQIYKLETSRDDYRLKVELQDKTMLELQARLDMLQQTAGEARNLKDEVDVLRETANKVENYEATIQSYKKKLNELEDLKRLVKLLESKNASYIQQNAELEEDLKKTGAWKAQAEVYKKQLADFEKKLDAETKRADKLEFESENVKQRLNAEIREKEHLIVERDTLREANEELQCVQLQNREIGNIMDSDIVPEDIAELKVQLVQLNSENKILKLNQKKPEDQNLAVVQSLLDDKTQAYNRLNQENRRLNQRIMELESESKEVDKMDENDASALKSKLTELQDKQHSMKEELDEKVSIIMEKSNLFAVFPKMLHTLEMLHCSWN